MDLTDHAKLLEHVKPQFSSVARGIWRMRIAIVNVYAIGASGGKWLLVDTGLPQAAPLVRQAAEATFDNPPEAIVLTHAHFDHAGNARTLADAWDVPVYVHRLELPYVTGQADYPPQDSTLPSVPAFISRTYPRHGINLGDRVRTLPENGTVPHIGGWRWLHTPGHTVGHVSLYRDEDQSLIAGDALTTTDWDAAKGLVVWSRQLHRPPSYFTPDWVAAKRSLETLAALEPKLIAAGHGLPMGGRAVAGDLHHLAETMRPPTGGRYTRQPAAYDEAGRPTHIPPPTDDPWKLPVYAGAAVLGGLALLGLMKRR